MKCFAEMVVVVLGILIAFQVEEWREDLREQREIDAALVRLKDARMVKRSRATRNASTPI